MDTWRRLVRRRCRVWDATDPYQTPLVVALREDDELRARQTRLAARVQEALAEMARESEERRREEAEEEARREASWKTKSEEPTDKILTWREGR